MLKRDTAQRDGFTLVEALISLVVISLCVLTLSSAFYGGLQNLRDEAQTLELVNHAEGKMDELIATDFANVISGSDFVTVQGVAKQRTWVVTPFDVDGDSILESDAMLIVVGVENLDVVFSTLLVDSAGEVTCKR